MSRGKNGKDGNFCSAPCGAFLNLYKKRMCQIRHILFFVFVVHRLVYNQQFSSVLDVDAFLIGVLHDASLQVVDVALC